MSSEHETGAADPRATLVRREANAMLISAAIFGFFGFIYLGQPMGTLYAVIVRSLQGGAIGFLLAGLLGLAGIRAAIPIYLFVSIVTAVIFLVCGVLLLVVSGFTDINGFLLIVFGLWNGASTLRSLGVGPGAGSP